MSSKIDFHVMELLASKICHDLISPIGAVNNGIELFEETGADAGDEVIELIAFSAQQASAKLQAYRMAYGAGGADASIKPEDVHETIEAFIGAEQKVIQDWDPHADLGYGDKRPDAYGKMLISAILLAIEALPKGGTIKVEAGSGETLVRAEGKDAGLREGMEEALALKTASDKLEPKHMHAYLTGLNAQNYDYNITIKDRGADHVLFSLRLTANER